MAKKKKQATPPDEKLKNQDLNLFDVLYALDNKDYGYYDNLTPEQQKKFVPFMMLKWMSAIKGNSNLSKDYLKRTDEYANKYMFNESTMRHPKLQWLMLCAASPGRGKQYHAWIPQIKDKVSKLKEPAKKTDVKEYFKKIYSHAAASDISLISDVFVKNHQRKMYLANKFPNMKYEDIETLSELITDEDIRVYEKDFGN